MRGTKFIHDALYDITFAIDFMDSVSFLCLEMEYFILSIIIYLVIVSKMKRR